MNRIFGFAGDIPCRDILLDGLEGMSGEYEMCGMALCDCNGLQQLKAKGGACELRKISGAVTDEYTAGIAQCACAERLAASVITAPPASDGNCAAVLDKGTDSFEVLTVSADASRPIGTDGDLLLSLIPPDEKNRPGIIKKLSELLGSEVGFAFMFKDECAVYARAGCSGLLVGICERGICLSSELEAMRPYAKRYFILEEGESVKITPEKAYAFDVKMKRTKKAYRSFPPPEQLTPAARLGIYACPSGIKRAFEAVTENGALDFGSVRYGKRALSGISRIIISGDRELYNAAAYGAYNLELMCDIPCLAVHTSELKYEGICIDKRTLLILLSRCGEDYDAVAVLKRAELFGADSLLITDCRYSCLSRRCASVISTGISNRERGAGGFPPYAFILALLALYIGNKKGIISELYLSVAVKMAELMPGKISASLKTSGLGDAAKRMMGAEEIITTGSAADYPAAREAAEIIRAHAGLRARPHPAGEPERDYKNKAAIAIITGAQDYRRTLSGLRRMKALGAQVIIITTANLEDAMSGFDCVISVPDSVGVLDSITCLCSVLALAEKIKDLSHSGENPQKAV